MNKEKKAEISDLKLSVQTPLKSEHAESVHYTDESFTCIGEGSSVKVSKNNAAGALMEKLKKELNLNFDIKKDVSTRIFTT